MVDPGSDAGGGEVAAAGAVEGFFRVSAKLPAGRMVSSSAAADGPPSDHRHQESVCVIC
jgi:hypothetical protein